jgi:hypothetical protein
MLFMENQTQYFVKLVNDKVVSYGRRGDFNSTKDPTFNINATNKDVSSTSSDKGNVDKLHEELLN